MGRVRFLPHLLFLALAALSLPLVAGFLNRLHPAFDSFAHFRLHLAAALGITALALLATRFRREGAVGLMLALSAWAATPGTLPRELVAGEATVEPRPMDRAIYRLLHVNARFDNPRPQELLSLIGRLRPDVVMVNEVSQAWRDKLALIEHAYPHSIVCDARGAVGGVAILSRRPFARGIQPRCHDGGTLAVAGLDLSGQTVHVAALHLYWPWPFQQPEQVTRLAPVLAGLPPASLLAGDFNAVRWSAAAASVARAGDLQNAGPGRPTWLHQALPRVLRPVLGLGIDHVMAGSGVAVHSVTIADDVGSDHLPVLTEFSLRRLPAGEQPGPEVQTVRLAVN